MSLVTFGIATTAVASAVYCCLNRGQQRPTSRTDQNTGNAARRALSPAQPQTAWEIIGQYPIDPSKIRGDSRYTSTILKELPTKEARKLLDALKEVNQGNKYFGPKLLPHFEKAVSASNQQPQTPWEIIGQYPIDLETIREGENSRIISAIFKRLPSDKARKLLNALIEVNQSNKYFGPKLLSHFEKAVSGSNHPTPLQHAGASAQASISYATPATGPFYSGRDLRGIWRQTEKLLEEGSYYSSKGKRVEIGTPGATTRQLPIPENETPAFRSNGYDTTFSVVNQDAIYAGMDLLNKNFKKVALLNPANAVQEGGGYLRGAAAMEEDICRRSALVPELKKQSYPLDGSTLLYTENVPFFRYGRDRQYEVMDKPVEISVITSAAIDLNPRHVGGTEFHKADQKYIDDHNKWSEETRLRAYAQLWKAAEEGNEAVVLTAFGCGAFLNDPEAVARIYRDVLEEKFRGVFDNVTFAVIDDHNANKAHNPRGNYRPFYEVFIEEKR